MGRQSLLTTEFVGADYAAVVFGENELEYRCNYFIGNDSQKWRTDVRNYRSVSYEEIYPGIKLTYRSNDDGRLEFDFIVSPGGDPAQIAVRYDGVTGICVDEFGDLVIETDFGRISEQLPQIYQIVDGQRRTIQGSFALLDDRTFGFRLSTDHQPEYAVIIDPVLDYSTYLGGTREEWAEAMTIDSDRNTYITGRTMSMHFPLMHPFQDVSHAYVDSGNGGEYPDVFVTKINSFGNSLIYSTYLGGTGHDRSFGIAVDDFGRCHVTGHTGSTDFPLSNAFQGEKGIYRDVFVTKLSVAGNSLVYSTYLGGNNN